MLQLRSKNYVVTKVTLKIHFHVLNTFLGQRHKHICSF